MNVCFTPDYWTWDEEARRLSFYLAVETPTGSAVSEFAIQSLPFEPAATYCVEVLTRFQKIGAPVPGFPDTLPCTPITRKEYLETVADNGVSDERSLLMGKDGQADLPVWKFPRTPGIAALSGPKFYRENDAVIARVTYAIMGNTNMEPEELVRCHYDPTHPDCYENFAEGRGSTEREAFENLSVELERVAELLHH